MDENIIPFHPNARDATQVEVLSGLGASIQYITKHLKLTPEELNTHYPRELAHGQEEANLRVSKVFHQMATSGEHPQITQAWLEMRAGWKKASTTSQATQDTDEADLDEAKAKLLKLLNRGK